MSAVVIMGCVDPPGKRALREAGHPASPTNRNAIKSFDRELTTADRNQSSSTGRRVS